MRSQGLFRFAFGLALIVAVAYVGVWKWGFCRVYVPQGKNLMVRFKGNLVWPSPPMAQGSFAEADEDGNPTEVGVLEQVAGPGRHFRFDPIHFDRLLVDDVVVGPREVGVVASKLGKELPVGEFLVDGDVGQTEFKGVLRKVLKPGRYRINPYGYTVQVVNDQGAVKTYGMPNQDGTQKDSVRPSAPGVDPKTLAGKRSGWVTIPAGYVGVVTNLAADPERNLQTGIQDQVLQPGIYAINPHEKQIDIVEIGYREITIKADLAHGPRGEPVLDENGEPMLMQGGNPGINFPSSDGFPISLDFTAIWGVLPEQAPSAVTLFGNVGEVETTVIVPEVESICRIHGSQLGAVELLIGDSRETFQQDVSNDFREVLAEKDISLQVGLVRHIYIPALVRGPIQLANIADELKLTRDIEIETAKVEADLEGARSTVELEEKRVIAETEKLYQEAMATGRKEVEEIKADTEKLVAAIAKETAEQEAQATLLLGEAEAKVVQFLREAEAQKFELAVKAFGSPEAYNQWVFATGLPEDMKLKLIHAGTGTLWTDLKSFQEAAAVKILKPKDSRDTSSSTPAARSGVAKQ